MRMKVYLLAGFAALAAPAAHSADLPPIIEPPVVEPFPKDPGGGWYLRGDIGYSIFKEPVVVEFGPTLHQEYLDAEFDHAFMVGGGIGYKWSDWFRTDLTIEHRFSTDFDGRGVCGGCSWVDNESDLKSWLFLANAYVDLGHWYGFSPYVGAGAGFAYHSLGQITGVSTSGVVQVPVDENTDWGFAAAAYAGFTYHFTSNLALDANYRYLWLGDLEWGGDGFGNNVRAEDVAAHDIRVGMRYTFN